MTEEPLPGMPAIYPDIVAKCAETGFTMPSDQLLGALLKSLVASKPNGSFLELGTGIGLSLAWMADGLSGRSKITSIDNDRELTGIARSFFSHDERISLVCADGADWIRENRSARFDLVFADAWPGKYSELDEILEMIAPGGFYVVDDMNPQPNWPDGHQEKAEKLTACLAQYPGFTFTKLDWSTGVIICTRVAHITGTAEK